MPDHVSPETARIWTQTGIGAVHAARHPVEPTPQGVKIEDARVLADRMADNADANWARSGHCC